MRSFNFIPYLLLLFPFSHCSKPADDIKNDSGNYIKSTIQYNKAVSITPNLVSLNVYRFEQTTVLKPVIIWVHGGGWRIGDKTNSLSNKLALFNSLNYIFVSVNYRLSPVTNSTDPNRIKFPVHNNDVADAVKWVINSIAAYGGNKNKIVLLGHSAGAHLVSLTGTSQQFLPARSIPLNMLKGIASIDTEGYDVPSQNTEEIYQNAFGNNYNEQVKASPIYNISSSISYPRFFVAKRGSANRIALSDNFILKLRTAGVPVTEVNGSIYDHEGINDAIGNTNDTVITPALKQFLSLCFQ
ncbi:MAG: alpha/beta hydrolase [Ferruginibacter sp.]